MISTDAAKTLALSLFELNSAWSNKAANALLDIAEQLEYLEERDEISDKKLNLTREVSDGWKAEAMILQSLLDQERIDNIELRIQIEMLRDALLTS